MKASSKLTLLSLSVAMAVACGEAPKPAPAASPAPTLAPVVAVTTTETAVEVTQFGVPECDDYVAKYMACVDSKVPEAARALTKQGFEQVKQGWKAAAATPEGKAGLAAACTQAKESAKTAMAAYNCTF